MSADKMRDAFNAWSPFKWLNEHLPETTSRNQDYSLSHMSSIAFAAWQAASATQAAEIADLLAQLARIEPAEPVDLDMAARIDAAMLAEPSEEMLVLARKAIEYQAKFKLLSEGEQRAIISRAVAQCFPGTTDQQEGLIDRVEPVSAIDSDCHVCGGSYSHKPDCAYINATPQPIAQPAPSIPDFDLAVSDYRAMLAAAPKQNDGGE